MRNENARGARAQHSRKGAGADGTKCIERSARDHINNLEGLIASDTVLIEVNADFYRCFRLEFAD